ncbi:MAG: hypothetical protein Q9160_006266 [Pyrenula sp. 1 TL-2023]
MSQSYLRLKYHQKIQNAAEVDLVCIPDLPFKVGNIPWHSIDWEQFLPRIISVDVVAYIFDYELTFTDPFDWDNLWNQSDDLFRELNKLTARRLNKPKPILFFCERLGGIIFKETLLKIQARSHQQCALANEISGVVFLATPHSIDEDERGRTKFATILRRAYKEVKDSVFSQSDLTRLSLTSQRFEELPLDLPLLSVYESQPTRVLQPGFINVRKSPLVLVDHRYAKLDLPHVTFACSDIHVGDLAKSPFLPSRLHKDIATFLDEQAKVAAEQVRNSSEVLISTYEPSLCTRRTNSGMTTQLPLSPKSQVSFPTHGSSSTSSPSSKSDRSDSHSSEGSFEAITDSSASSISVNDLLLPYRQISPHAPNEDFFPRPKFTQALRNYLLPLPDIRGRSGPNPKTFVLYGPAGHGKTELAVSFFFDHWNDYDVAIFIHGDNADKLRHEISDCVIGLGLVNEKDARSDSALCHRELMSWLEYPVKKSSRSQRWLGRQPKLPEAGGLARVLIVIDNADDPELVLDSCWPRHGLCSILVTSQSPAAMSKQYFGLNGLEVGPLSEEEGMDMLSQLTSNPLTDDSSDGKVMREIISRLKGFPLAIAGASSMVLSQQLSLEDLKDWLYEEDGYEGFLQQRIGGKIQRGYKYKNVGASLALDMSNEMPGALLSVASFLDPDGVPESILTANIGPDALEDSHYPEHKSEYRQARTALLQRSILKRNKEKQTLWFHRIPRDLSLALLKKSPDDMRKLFEIAVLLVQSQWPSSIGAAVGKWSEVQRWEACSKLYIQIRSILSAYEANETILSSMRHVKSLIELFADAGRYQFEVANVAEAHLMTDTALKLCEALGDKFLFLKSYAYGVRTLLWLEHNDGQKGYHHAGIWVGLEEQFFERTKKPTGQYAAAYNAMGVACAKCGLFAKAKLNLYKSKEIRESMVGFKPAHNFSPFRELGRIAIAQGEYNKGEEILMRALKDREADLKIVGDEVSERLVYDLTYGLHQI